MRIKGVHARSVCTNLASACQAALAGEHPPSWSAVSASRRSGRFRSKITEPARAAAPAPHRFRGAVRCPGPHSSSGSPARTRSAMRPADGPDCLPSCRSSPARGVRVLGCVMVRTRLDIALPRTGCPGRRACPRHRLRLYRSRALGWWLHRARCVAAMKSGLSEKLQRGEELGHTAALVRYRRLLQSDGRSPASAKCRHPAAAASASPSCHSRSGFPAAPLLSRCSSEGSLSAAPSCAVPMSPCAYPPPVPPGRCGRTSALLPRWKCSIMPARYFR